MQHAPTYAGIFTRLEQLLRRAPAPQKTPVIAEPQHADTMDPDQQRFFGFTRPPFEPATPGQIFFADSQSTLAANLLDQLERGDLLAVRGGSGVGKTTLLRMVGLAVEKRNTRIVSIDASSHTAQDVVRLIARNAGLPEAPQDLATLLRVPRAEQGVERVVLLVDDAHDLSAEGFALLKQLLDQRGSDRARFHALLAGRLGPWRGLQAPGLEEMRSATSACYMMFPLPESEAASYIDFKLRQAGQSWRRVITGSAMGELIDRADGVPARLDQLALRALAHGYATGQARITVKTLRGAFADEDVMILQRRREPGRRMAAAGLGVAVLAGAGALWAWQGSRSADEAVLVARNTPPPAQVKAPVAEPGAPEGVAAPTHAAPMELPLAFLGEPVDSIAVTDLSTPPTLVLAAAASLPTPAIATTRELPAFVAAARPAETAVARLAAAPPLRLAAIGATPGQAPRGGPGLVLIAATGDDLKSLYWRVYRGLTPPAFSDVLAANRKPLRPGGLVIFPEPPAGWSRP
jgi:type II secretory pathway predicted ATPase ExeA